MNNTAEIYMKDVKKPVFRVSLNEPNARLIVPIVNYFLQYRPEENKEVVSDDSKYAGPYAGMITGNPAAPEGNLGFISGDIHLPDSSFFSSPFGQLLP